MRKSERGHGPAVANVVHPTRLSRIDGEVVADSLGTRGRFWQISGTRLIPRCWIRPCSSSRGRTTTPISITGATCAASWASRCRACHSRTSAPACGLSCSTSMIAPPSEFDIAYFQSFSDFSQDVVLWGRLCLPLRMHADDDRIITARFLSSHRGQGLAVSHPVQPFALRHYCRRADLRGQAPTRQCLDHQPERTLPRRSRAWRACIG